MNAKGVAMLLLLAVAGASAQPMTKKDLVTAIQDNAQLSALFGAVSQFPDLVETLKTFNGTVFAPNNKAFADALAAAEAAGVEVDAALLEQILKYHVVAGEALLKADITDGQELTTVLGPALTAKYVDGALTIEAVGSTANVLREMKVGPAAVHIIDAVLLPVELPAGPVAPAPGPAVEEGPMFPDVPTAAVESNLTLLVAAVGVAGLEDALGPDFNGTVFAPTNEAFEALLAKLPGFDITNLTAEQKEQLTSILLYHVVPDAAVFAADLEDGQEITTASGETLTVSIKEDGKVFLMTGSDQEVEVVATDVTAGKAVVHVIGEVLVPGSQTGESPEAPEATPVGAATSTMASIAALAGSALAAALLL